MIVAEPAITGVTTPVPEPTVATDVLLLLHAPPDVASLNVVVEPVQTVVVPAIKEGKALTVATFVALQPVAREYDIVDVPDDTPVTMPVVPIVAIVVVLLAHVPLPVASLKVVVEPAHTLAVPAIADGTGLTVTILVALQPVTREYDIVDVPDATPVTTPVEEPTVAIVDVLLVHVPLLVTSLKPVVKPAQTVAVPAIADGTGLTVTTFVDLQPVRRVYVIVDVPEAAPVTTPVEEPIVATVVVLLAHVPPALTSLKPVVKPVQTVAVPDIADGTGLTVATFIAIHPVARV